MNLLKMFYRGWLRRQPQLGVHANLASLTHTMYRRQLTIDRLTTSVNTAHARAINGPYPTYVDLRGDVQ
jgi:hypothetical protein